MVSVVWIVVSWVDNNGWSCRGDYGLESRNDTTAAEYSPQPFSADKNDVIRAPHITNSKQMRCLHRRYSLILSACSPLGLALATCYTVGDFV